MPRPRPRSPLSSGLVALCGLVAGGCGPQTATVVGRVTCQGQPVPGGSVIVYCSDKQIARGIIGTDGAYAIPNVPHGAAVVTVQAPVRAPTGLRPQQNLPPSVGGPLPPADEAPDPARVRLPPRYALPEESGLTVAIDRERVTYDIDLKP